MNRQGAGKIDYCDFSLNIVRGPCHHACPYCYMKDYRKRFDPPAEFKYPAKAPRKKPGVVFVGSSTDMFGAWVPTWYIEKTLNYIKDYPQHTYLLLTKAPSRYQYFKFPANTWLGTTWDGYDLTRHNLRRLAEIDHPNKWVSFEPLKAFIGTSLLNQARTFGWFVIGADSTRGVERPPVAWGQRIIKIVVLTDV